MKTSIDPVLIAFALVCFALLPSAQAVVPAPDGGYPNGNTAEGTNALFSLANGVWNTALGFEALNHDTAGGKNTATGLRALFSDTTGSFNTATGVYALYSNTTGWYNSAIGANALSNNITGQFNTATGYGALNHNKTDNNTANGFGALFVNTNGSSNVAVGVQALNKNSTGNNNTANGAFALFDNVSGGNNVAMGNGAGINSTGSGNIYVGANAGSSVTTANNMIAIGAPGAGPFADISNTCFIGSIHNQPVSNAGSAQDVYVDQFNVLGFLPSSRRFKHDIKPMDKASEVVLALKPVTYKYNGGGPTQYGVIAEEVAEVAPDLVFRDKNGDVQTVRFDQIGAMLLNEFIKEHSTVEQLKAKVAKQEAIIAQQQKGMEVLTAQLNEQAVQIQKVSAQLEVIKPGPRVVNNDQ